MLTRSIIHDVVASISVHGVALRPTVDSKPSLGRHVCLASRGHVHDEQHCKPVMSELARRLGVDALYQAQFRDTADMVARLERIGREVEW